MAPIYGQVVAGPPGSGKTTYCTGMQEYLRLLGRDAWVINLDPANEVPSTSSGSEAKQNTTDQAGGGKDNDLPYDTLLDVCESVVNVTSVMEQLGLGPNGGLIYCMEYIEEHIDEVVQMIKDRVTDGMYLLFDLPGQVELYTHGSSVPRLLHKLCNILDLRLVAVQLIDAHYCTEAANFLSAALLGTTTMLRLELPTVSVLSKIDLLINYGPLPFSLDFFTDCHELDRLLPFLGGGGGLSDMNKKDDPFDDEFEYVDDSDYQKARMALQQSPLFRKHEKLHRMMAEVVDDFGLLSFLPLDISEAESVARVLARIDKCNGYVFKTMSSSNTNSGSDTQNIFQCAVKTDSAYETIADVQERLEFAREQKAKNNNNSSNNNNNKKTKTSESG